MFGRMSVFPSGQSISRTAGRRTADTRNVTIVDMTDKVVRNLASGYEKVREGVKDVMGGRILEYEAKRIREEGLEQGLERGLEQGLERGLEQGLEKGRHEILMELVYDGILTMEEAAERMGKNRERKE